MGVRFLRFICVQIGGFRPVVVGGDQNPHPVLLRGTIATSIFDIRHWFGIISHEFLSSILILWRYHVGSDRVPVAEPNRATNARTNANSVDQSDMVLGNL